MQGWPANRAWPTRGRTNFLNQDYLTQYPPLFSAHYGISGEEHAGHLGPISCGYPLRAKLRWDTKTPTKSLLSLCVPPSWPRVAASM